jgi:hypothetical protein
MIPRFTQRNYKVDNTVEFTFNTVPYLTITNGHEMVAPDNS